MSNEPVIVEKLFNVPVSVIWNALIDKDEIKKWYFDLPEFKPEAGFEFSFTAGPEGGEQFVHLCKITEVVNERKITYSWRYEGYPGDSLVTWELEPQNVQTKLTVTHRGIESMASNGPDFSKESFSKGWTYFVYDALPLYLKK